MSDSNREQISYGVETTFATVPAVAFQEVRFTSDSLGQDTETTSSQEIRSDRQVSDIIRTNISAAGDVAGELSYGARDPWLKGVLQSAAWSSASSAATGTDYTFAAAGQTVTSGSNNEFSSLAAGDWITISGAAQSANNGTFRINAVQSTNPGTADNDRLVLEHGLTSIVNESTGATVVVTKEARITNGTTFESYLIQKQFQDLTNIYEIYYGMAPNTWNLSIGLNGIATTTFGFIGSKAESKTSNSSTGSVTAATTAAVMNSIDNVVAIKDASTGSSNLCFQNWSLDLNNNLRARGCIGRLGAASIGSGTVDLTGSTQALFESHAIIDQYLNFTTSYQILRLRDAANNRYIIDVPAIKYTNARRVAGGINQDIIADLSWSAFRHSTLGYTIRIVRIPGP